MSIAHVIRMIHVFNHCIMLEIKLLVACAILWLPFFHMSNMAKNLALDRGRYNVHI